MNITLYKNKSEPNRLRKDLTGEIALDGTLRDGSSVINPVILIQRTGQTLSRYNYLKINEFNRYYFIDDITVVRNNLWQIKCSVDVLYTYRSAILDTNVILSDSQEKGASDYLTGEQWRSTVKTKTDIVNFSNGLLETGEYILITAGG